MKELRLISNNPTELGHIHGESLREKIREIYEIRLERILSEGLYKNKNNFIKSKNLVLDLCEQHVDIFKQFDEDLYSEALGIAESSNLSLAQVILLNAYTDIRDIGYLKEDSQSDPGGCSAVFLPSESGNLLGQTWDIHGTAVDYVVLLDIEFRNRKTKIFSIAGCLGMTGLSYDLGPENSKNSIGVCINNLNSLNAKIGPPWPAVIRKLLKQKNAKRGKDLLLNMPNSSGRFYAVADRQDYFGVEKCGELKEVIQTSNSKNSQVNFHTNHALSKKISENSRVRENSTTYIRYKKLEEKFENSNFNYKNLGLNKFFELFELVSYPINKVNPEKTATCGAMAMNLETNEYLACKGPVL